MNALGTLAFGGLVGAVAFGASHRWKIRSRGALLGITLLVAVVAFYAHWAVWINAFLNRVDVPSSLLPVLLSPVMIWDVVAQINEVGAWSLRDLTPTGAFLWAVWGGEAAVFFGAALFGASLMFGDLPFCEACGTWCEKQTGACVLAAPPRDELQDRLEAKDLGYLARIGPPAPDADSCYRLDIDACPKCGTTNTLDVKLATLKIEHRVRPGSTATMA